MRKQTLGSPPTVSFAAAFKKAGDLLAAAKLGSDPAGEARKVKDSVTVRDLVTRYTAYQQPRLKPRSYQEMARHLEAHAKPLHGRRASQVTRSAAVGLLQGIAKTAPVTANRVRASLSAMFAWGMKAGLAAANPVAATFKPAPEQPRERVLTDPELALIWSCTAGAADHGRIVRLLMLTGARREEIAGMEWREVTRHGDGSATWVLPAKRSKNHLANELLLPPMVTSLLPEPREGADQAPREFLFGEGRGPFSGWSRCKERLDQRIAGANGGKAIPAWVLHDLRRTLVTRLNDMQVEPHVIEALVNHAGGIARAGVAGVYNKSTYAVPKRTALALWCDFIARLVGEQPTDRGEVVPLRRAG